METNEIKKPLGLCPICKKGYIIENQNGWGCNYFKNVDDKCVFQIYQQYFGLAFNDDIILSLIEDGETEFFEDLQSKEGKRFSAKFKIENKRVVPVFKKTILESKCPKCENGIIHIYDTGYGCSNFKNNEQACDFFIKKEIAGKSITAEIAEELCTNHETSFLKFISNTGKEFEAKLSLDENKNVSFSSNIGVKCPKCQEGEIYLGQKAFNCSNFKKNGCDFAIWREIGFRTISIEEAVALIKNKKLESLCGFKNKQQEEFTANLIIDENFKIKISNK